MSLYWYDGVVADFGFSTAIDLQAAVGQYPGSTVVDKEEISKKEEEIPMIVSKEVKRVIGEADLNGITPGVGVIGTPRLGGAYQYQSWENTDTPYKGFVSVSLETSLSVEVDKAQKISIVARVEQFGEDLAQLIEDNLEVAGVEYFHFTLLDVGDTPKPIQIEATMSNLTEQTEYYWAIFLPGYKEADSRARIEIGLRALGVSAGVRRGLYSVIDSSVGGNTGVMVYIRMLDKQSVDDQVSSIGGTEIPQPPTGGKQFQSGGAGDGTQGVTPVSTGPTFLRVYLKGFKIADGRYGIEQGLKMVGVPFDLISTSVVSMEDESEFPDEDYDPDIDDPSPVLGVNVYLKVKNSEDVKYLLRTVKGSDKVFEPSGVKVESIPWFGGLMEDIDQMIDEAVGDG